MVPQQWDVLISTTWYNELYHLYRSPQADHRTAKLEVQMLHLGDGTWSSGIRVALSPWIFLLRRSPKLKETSSVTLTCTLFAHYLHYLHDITAFSFLSERHPDSWVSWIWWSAQAPLPSVALEGSKSDGSSALGRPQFPRVFRKSNWV